MTGAFVIEWWAPWWFLPLLVFAYIAMYRFLFAYIGRRWRAWRRRGAERLDILVAKLYSMKTPGGSRVGAGEPAAHIPRPVTNEELHA